MSYGLGGIEREFAAAAVVDHGRSLSYVPREEFCGLVS
jgi:hypothetical protein